jgi:cAMP-dependent protein kinase regulator
VNGDEVGTYQPGQSFGELALMYNQARKATIKASSSCKVWSLERKIFAQTAQYYKEQQKVRLMDVLSRVPSLKALSELDRHILAESLEVSTYEDDEYVSV